jgi:hypothetical protein
MPPLTILLLIKALIILVITIAINLRNAPLLPPLPLLLLLLRLLPSTLLPYYYCQCSSCLLTETPAAAVAAAASSRIKQRCYPWRHQRSHPLLAHACCCCHLLHAWCHIAAAIRLRDVPSLCWMRMLLLLLLLHCWPHIRHPWHTCRHALQLNARHLLLLLRRLLHLLQLLLLPLLHLQLHTLQALHQRQPRQPRYTRYRLHRHPCWHALLLLLLLLLLLRKSLHRLYAMLLHQRLHLVRLQPMQLHTMLRQALHCCHSCLNIAR